MTYWLSDLPAVLRSAGLYVVEAPGWQTRSYINWSPGYVQKPTHVMVHHTASQTTAANDVAYIIAGKPNPPGPNLSPICNIYLARNGAVYVIAAGKSVTNGAGSSRPWNGGVPDNEMNHYAIGIEAGNNGIGEPWPKAQTDAYVVLCAALCKAYDIPVNHVRAHWEWTPGRKIDPAGQSPYAIGKASWSMDRFRADVTKALAPTPPPAFITVEDDMIILNDPPRIYSSKTTGGPLAPGVPRIVAVPVVCRAAIVNIVAVAPKGNGNMQAWGSGPTPASSKLNFTPGESVANEVHVPVINGAFIVMASAATDFIVDLVGYYP